MNELRAQTAMNLLVVILAISSLCPSALALLFWLVSALEKSQTLKWMQPITSEVSKEDWRWR